MQNQVFHLSVFVSALLATSLVDGAAHAQPAAEALPEPPPVAAPDPSGGVEPDPGAATPAPAPPPAAAATPTIPAAPPSAPKAYPRFEPSMRLMTGFERTSETRFGAPANSETERFGFFLSQVRAQLEGKLTKRIELELSAELADAYEAAVVQSANKPPYLRDAFLNLRLKRAFQITMGHFKRPISALEHRNAGKLQVRGRGLTNDLLIEDNAWGSRGLGMQLWGKFKSIGTTWAVGVFDPAWAPSVASRPKGVDVLARLAVEVVEGLTLGLNGGLKTLDTPPFDEYKTFYGVGGDLELEVGPLNFLAEGLYAQLPQVAAGLEEQTAAGVVGLLAYDFPIVPELTLQPVLFGEYSDRLRGLDPDLGACGRGRPLHDHPHRGTDLRRARHQARAGGNHRGHPERRRQRAREAG
jgi:hypothetical protein